MVGHKTSLNKFKKIEMISSIFLDHNPRNQPQGKNSKYSHSWRLNNMLLNKDWVNNEIKKEIKKYQETNEIEQTTTENLWDTVKVVLRRK